MMRHTPLRDMRGANTAWGGRRSGFTLVELLAVTAIIALLIAIILPSMRRSVRHARATMCTSNLRELYVGLEIYRAENNGWLPSTTASGAYRAAQSWWAQMVAPDPAVRGVLVCPDDPWAAVLRDQIVHGTFGAEGPGSYGLNEFIISSPTAFLANLGRFSPTRPNDTILVADLGPDAVGQTALLPGQVRPPSRNNGKLAVDDLYRPGYSNNEESASWLTGRHMGFINMLSIVGNVRTVPTRPVMDRIVESYYDECAAGDCSLCRYMDIPHYSFTEGHSYWWTGRVPRQ